MPALRCIAVDVFYDGVSKGVNVKFPVNVSEMAADRPLADLKLLGNLLSMQSLNNGIEDCLLAPGQLVVVFSFCLRFLTGSDHQSSDGGRHRRATVIDFANRIEDVPDRLVFDQVTHRAGLKRADNLARAFLNGQDDDGRIRDSFFEPSNAFASAQARQVQVDQNHVGFQCRRFFQSSFGVWERADTLKTVGIIEHKLQALAKLGMIVNGHNPNGRA